MNKLTMAKTNSAEGQSAKEDKKASKDHRPAINSPTATQNKTKMPPQKPAQSPSAKKQQPAAQNAGAEKLKSSSAESYKPKKEVSIVLLGQTGVGKTTLMTALKDMLSNVPFENRSAVLKNNDAGNSQTIKTQQFCFDNKTTILKLIDTPGIGDTGGIQVDTQHLANIVANLIEIGEFNVIIFVMSSNNNRYTLDLRYVINELKTLLPKYCADNFMVCLTSSSIPEPGEDSLAVIKKLGLPENSIVCVDNVAYKEIAIKPNNHNSAQTLKRLKNAYEETHEGLQILIEKAATFAPFKSDGIKEIKIKRDKLNENIGILNIMVQDSLRAKIQFKRIRVEIEDAIKDKEKNQNWNIKTTVTRTVAQRADGVIVTACKICGVKCHEGCYLKYGVDLEQCAGILGSSCLTCSHSVNEHFHSGWVLENKEEDVFTEDLSIKAAHDNAEHREKMYRMKLKQVQARIVEERKKISNFQTEIHDLYKEISQLSLVGHNYVYEDYLNAKLKYFTDAADMPRSLRDANIKLYKEALVKYQTFATAIKA